MDAKPKEEKAGKEDRARGGEALDVKAPRSSVGMNRENWLAPFVVTKELYLQEIVAMAKISDRDVFYDIGCGEGHVLKYVAKHTKARKLVGIEHNKELAFSSLEAVKNAGFDEKRVAVKHSDAMLADLSEATVAYLYLTINGMKLFETQLVKMLDRGTRIISMWPRQCSDEAKACAKESIRYFNPADKTFSDKMTHSFGLKIYKWEPVSTPSPRSKRLS
mmetsp:Transcript_31028/g.75663  ORF Transcript_31028/g.75663 Transcript_31028/m.75663 type:complete len:219 (-) Transcript_31028:152-808(-)